jgi:hypothetical protein
MFGTIAYMHNGQWEIQKRLTKADKVERECTSPRIPTRSLYTPRRVNIVSTPALESFQKSVDLKLKLEVNRIKTNFRKDS